MKVSVDADVCYGSGECAFRAPAVFGFQDGYGFVLPGREEYGEEPGDGDELIRDIAERCPSQAIRINGRRVTD
ncbi:ferredoxin [Streptomyces sp. Ag109_O5-10]|uniref:ferredoxin n=1 Tax=Streptomyces sp. Ag109_O5-10 TaxID=1855349 RepID=UPI00089B5C69|nr:ferredoxin [Streptomyces sp. Ag109_O5-10]SEE90482.1 ferredoxin [Streptomyces sp. Ag109_O5-10]